MNIQRGRDHGIPPYTQWREPCGLSPIKDWVDFEKILGPESTRRIQQGYNHVDDVDLFVGGLAERPVVGGLVGPVFACIIAQQFSNLRKGDRYWYENDGFDSSFTPAQLQSIRQVLLSQVICRTLGSGTLQPHIFLPHDIESNERMLCGTDALSPIDLKPWLERDPFLKKLQDIDATTNRNDNRKHTTSVDPPNDKNQTILNKIDFPNGGNGGSKRPNKQKIQEPFLINRTIINNKLDLGTNSMSVLRPLSHNKVILKTGQRRKAHTTPRPNLRATTKGSNKRRKTSNRKPINRDQTVHRRQEKNIRQNHVQKRDLTNVDKSRGAIIVDLANGNNYSPFNKGRPLDDKKPLVILTPEESNFEIEINIRQTGKPDKNPTPKPYHHGLDSGSNNHYHPHRQEFYNVKQPAQPSNPYSVNSDQTERPINHFDDFTTRPSYYGIITKRPTFSDHYYGGQHDDDIQTTRRPYYDNDITTKRPLHSNYYFNDDLIPTNHVPIYNRPTSIQSDPVSYGVSSKPQFGTHHDANNDEYYKPYHTQRPQSIYNDNKPSNDGPNYQYRPPSQTQNDQGYYGNRPANDDFITSRPRPKPTTPFSYNSYGQNDQTDRPLTIYLHDDWDKTTTRRPQILAYDAYDPVQTTRRKIRTSRPTKPVNQYPQDDTDPNEGIIESTISTFFSPTTVLTNIVNTFSDYFGSPTTTKRPYIQHDESDDWNGNPYAPSSSSSFQYSRQKDVHVFDNRLKSSTENVSFKTFDDNNETTQRPVLNQNGHMTEDDDPYWYLRPHNTNYDKPKNYTINTSDDRDDYEVQETRNTEQKNDKKYTKDNYSYANSRPDVTTNLTSTQDPNLTKPNDHKKFNGHTLDIAENEEAHSDGGQRESRAKKPVLFVPLNILTKPER